MNPASLDPGSRPLPSVGDDNSGVRDYPDRAPVIRASQRTLLAGLLSLSLPGVAWPLAACAHKDLVVAAQLSRDPIATRPSWPRHIAYAVGAGISTGIGGAVIGIAWLVACTVLEGLHLLFLFHREPPGFWNPARRHLYAGAWFSYLARIQFFTLVAVLLVFVIGSMLDPR